MISRSDKNETPTKPPMLSVEEIRRRYPDEWVLLIDPQCTPTHRVLAGRVLRHGPNRDDLDKPDFEGLPYDLAILYTGRFPEDAVLCL